MNPHTVHRRLLQLLVALGVALAVTALLALALPAHAEPPSEETHDSFHAGLRVPPHGRCTISKSDAQVRAHLACRDGWTRRVSPCRWEDSRRCFWHAPSRGNGQGRSFVAIAGGRHHFTG